MIVGHYHTVVGVVTAHTSITLYWVTKVSRLTG